MSHEILAPHFSLNDTINYHQNNGIVRTWQRVADDLKFQCWEATDIPISDPFKLITKKVNGELKVVAECDANDDSNLDLLDITSKKYRRGIEYEAVSNIKQACIEAPVGSTILQFNPSQDKTESAAECNYKKAQANIIYRVSDTLSIQYQIQAYLNTDQVVSLRKALVGEDLKQLAGKTFLDSLISSVSVVGGFTSLQRVMAEVTKISSQRFDSLAVIEKQKRQIDIRSKFSSWAFVSALEKGDHTPKELQGLYESALGNTLPDRFLNKIRDQLRFSGGSIASFSTSCGFLDIALPGTKSYSLIGSLYREGFRFGNKKGSCSKCFEKNVVLECGWCTNCIQGKNTTSAA